MTTTIEHLRRLRSKAAPPVGAILLPSSVTTPGVSDERPNELPAVLLDGSWPRWLVAEQGFSGPTVPIRVGTVFTDDNEFPVLQWGISGGTPMASFQGRRLMVVGTDPNRYRDRIRALPGADVLVNKRVLLVGCGSVGSDIGTRLTRMGVATAACDPDVLAMENLVRWGVSAPWSEVGLPKVNVWAQHVQATVPNAQVTGHVMDVVTQSRDFETLLLEYKPDVVVVSTDTRDSRFVVAGLCAQHRVPALFVALSDGAASARFEMIPNTVDWPCHQCSSSMEGDAAPSFGTATLLPYATDNAQTAVPALGVNVAVASGWATRILIHFLGGLPWQLYFEQGQQRGNVLFLGLEPDTWLFQNPLDRLVYQPERVPDCPLCGGKP